MALEKSSEELVELVESCDELELLELEGASPRTILPRCKAVASFLN
jgi:hypothetical protein